MSEHAKFWTPDGIRAAAGGTWLARPADPTQPLSGVSIDSREIGPGRAFIAIKGDRTDGHLYVEQAVAAGAPLILVSSDVPALPPGVGALRVADTRTALLRLGAAWRKLLESTRVVAVVGSNGKTTTVRLIDAALGSAMKGAASIKSFNNAIGVPLTILGAKRTDQYLVCEVGTSSPGEIATLAQVVQPDIAVITSIGREHLEFLGSVKGVATEESSVLDHVRPGGIGVVTADSPDLDEVLRARESRRAAPGPALLRVGLGPTSDIRVVRSTADGASTTFELNDRAEFTIPLLGAHNASNAAMAVAVARRLRIPDDSIRAGLAAVSGASMRLERRRIGSVDLINDAYNANPDSVLAAVATLASLRPAPGGRRVLILGDMLELGPLAPALHADVLATVASQSGIDHAILVGPLMSDASRDLARAWGSSRVQCVPDSSAPHAEAVAAAIRPGDVVLLKASRGTRLERIADAIEAAHDATPVSAPSLREPTPAPGLYEGGR